MSTSPNPFVSCLCSSRPCRWGSLQRAILDFNAQVYANRELVIAADLSTDYPSMIQSFVDSLALTAAVRVLPRTVKCQIDGLHQAAIAAYGGVMVLWDDDNLNHPDRLAVQVDRQTANPASLTTLSEGLYYFWEDNELFAVDCANPNAQYVWERMLSTSTMGYRDAFPVLDFTARARTSDTLLKNAVQAGRKIAVISGQPFLHTVTVSRSEQCPSSRDYTFHRTTATERCGRTADWMRANQAALTAALDQYALGGKISVEGRDAGAFEYEPKVTWPATLYPVVA